jgi:hypothetical protein
VSKRNIPKLINDEQVSLDLKIQISFALQPLKNSPEEPFGVHIAVLDRGDE